MRFGVLGPVAAWTAEGRPVRVPERKVRALLADLLVHEGRPVAVERLVEHLWGAQEPGDPLNSLQTKVSQLRRALESAEPGGRRLVVRRPPGYRLLLEPNALDVHRFRALTAQARRSTDLRARVALLSDALALWRGPALADVHDEPFAVATARRLEEERLAAEEERAEARLTLGGVELGPLVAELGDLVARHPLRERVRGLHMRALYRTGRQGEALESFAELRSRLIAELGLEPGPELTAMQQSILTQDPALQGPAPAPQAGPRHRIPAPLTGLVGRDAAVGQVRSRLGSARLVTLTGPGGVGKTRLAMAVARELTDDADAGGACLVELAGLDRQACPEAHCPAGDWVVEVVAAALGVRDTAAVGAPTDGTGVDDDVGDLAERMGEALARTRLLLVLDNCEQVVEPVAALAERLLRAAPGLRILATSREPLGTAGEVLHDVPPLELPTRADESDLVSVQAASAVQLFAERAAAAAPGFVLDAHTAPAVAAICRHLDGLPLALELAASRVRALGVQELLARLDDRFALLAGGPRGAPDRQRTLRATIDWSWELLTTPERIVLRRLAAHPEGCDLEAAEAVCAGDGVQPGEVLDLLARLVDRSLVVGRIGPGGAPRFHLLESVAAYSLERMADAGELERVRQRHSHHYLELAERAEPELRGAEQQHWLERLDAESANLRAALDHLVQQADGGGQALRLATAVCWYLFLRGRTGEAVRSLGAALAVPGAAPPASRAQAAAWLTALRVLDGEPPGDATLDLPELTDPVARTRTQWLLGHALATVGNEGDDSFTAAALATFETIGDRWGTAAALVDRVSQVMRRGRFDEARELAERAAVLFREVGDRWGQVQATFALGLLEEIGGHYERAAGQHRAGLRMAEELGLWAEVSYQLSWLGRVALVQRRYAEAERLHRRAERTAVQHGFTPGRIYALTGLALGARRTGDLDVAQSHLHEILRWHRGVGGEPATALLHAELGFVAEVRGDGGAALCHQLDGYTVARRSGDPRALALALEGLAGAVALCGAARLAAGLLGAAAAARESVGAPLPPGERGDVDRVTGAVEEVLGAHSFATEFARGRAADPDELSAAAAAAADPASLVTVGTE